MCVSLFFTRNTDAYNDKTSVVSKNCSAIMVADQTFIGNRMYNEWSVGTGYVSVNHRVGMTSSGFNILIGDPINFAYNPDNPFFLNTGNGNWDTPYGEWSVNLNAPFDKNKIASQRELSLKR